MAERMSAKSESETSELSSLVNDVTHITGASVPLFLTTAYQDELQRNKNNTLPQLPSHRFRFSVWHDVSKISTTGDQLHAPRVRQGPSEKDRFFYHLRDENGKRIHHTYKGQERMDYQQKQENWEATIYVNLTYQELYHQYQKANFLTILKRLKSAIDVVIMDNGLVDLNTVTFPVCKTLNACRNHLKYFKHLPKIPKIEHLNMRQNDITSFSGLGALAQTQIRSLDLRENPIYFTINYRKKIFKALPTLRILDEVPKQTSDDEPFEDDTSGNNLDEKSSQCVIS